jgi:hypothetical protein
MALFLHQAGAEPLGQYDHWDNSALAMNDVKGGEVCTLVAASSATELAAEHADGYLFADSQPAVKTGGLTGAETSFYLTDDGLNHYGTSLGYVTGAVAGRTLTGAHLGPHTATGSGKMTLWQKPGLYGVSLDAVDQANDGLVPTNAALVASNELGYTAEGRLTPLGSAADVASAAVATLVEFSDNKSTVSTPRRMARGGATQFDRVLIDWRA